MDDPVTPNEGKGEGVGEETRQQVNELVGQLELSLRSGTSMLSTSSVIATAITPSVNATMRPRSVRSMQES